MSLDQLYLARPVPLTANYRCPLAGLYLCGSGAHPGIVIHVDIFWMFCGLNSLLSCRTGKWCGCGCGCGCACMCACVCVIFLLHFHARRPLLFRQLHFISSLRELSWGGEGQKDVPKAASGFLFSSRWPCVEPWSSMLIILPLASLILTLFLLFLFFALSWLKGESWYYLPLLS